MPLVETSNRSDPGVVPELARRVIHGVLVDALQAVAAPALMASVWVATGEPAGVASCTARGVTSTEAMPNDQVAPGVVVENPFLSIRQ